jgi:hypothetical protein
MLERHPGLNSTHVKPYSLNLEGAVAALSYVPIISPFSLRIAPSRMLREAQNSAFSSELSGFGDVNGALLLAT